MSFGTPNLVAVKTFQTKEVGYGTVRRTEFLFQDHPLAMASNAGVTAFGTLQLYTYPQGLLFQKGIVVNLTALRSATGLNATFRATFGLGTAQADNSNTLATTEQDQVNSIAANPASAVAGLSTWKALGIAPAAVDGTTATGAAKQLWLNVLVNTADETLSVTPTNLLLNGSITLNWEVMGDK